MTTHPRRVEMTTEELRRLRDPRLALRACAKVPTQDAKDGQNLVKYDPTHITARMQQDILSYIADPPRNIETGMTMWMLLIGARQTGKSWTTEAGFYAKTAYAQQWKHLCTADTGDRAGELIKNVNSLHKTWPRTLRAERQYDAEVWQATFREMRVGDEHLVERIMRTQHAGQNPIGLPWDSIHWSEFTFSPEAPAYWSGLRPAIANRGHALMVWESTPNPGNLVVDCGFGRAMYCAAKAGREGEDGMTAPSRFFAKFYPFWDGKLNRSPWPTGSKPDLEEQRLYDAYHGKGLTWEHLAYRRRAMAEDQMIRRDPALFGIWYPFDDQTCWVKVEGAVFYDHHLERHRTAGRLVAWTPVDNHLFYRGWRKDPGVVDPDAGYLLAVDPNGYRGRDHGAATLREVWHDEEFQVAAFKGGRREGVNPETLGHWVGKTARRFKADVLVESNGVGQGILTLLRSQYPDVRLVCHNNDPENPGIPASSKTKAEALALHKDALLKTLTLQDEDTWNQHGTYQNDKQYEETDGQLQLSGGHPSRGRNPRHHYDSVSAEMWASWGVAHNVCRRPLKPVAPPPVKDRPETVEEWDMLIARLDGGQIQGAFTPQVRT